MDIVYFILLLLGALCFARAATGFATTDARGDGGRRDLSLVPLGLLFWISVSLLQAGRVVFD